MDVDWLLINLFSICYLLFYLENIDQQNPSDLRVRDVTNYKKPKGYKSK